MTGVAADADVAADRPAIERLIADMEYLESMTTDELAHYCGRHTRTQAVEA